MKKGIILGVLGALLGLVSDYLDEKQMEIAVEEKVNEILDRRISAPAETVENG